MTSLKPRLPGHPHGPDGPDNTDGWERGDGDRGGREALTVLLLILFGGGTLITASNRVLHYSHTIGVVLFAVLPIVAVLTAATRLDHH